MRNMLIVFMLTLMTSTSAFAQAPFETLKRLREEYPTPMVKEETGELLNRVAWAHKGEGWGLLGKASGNNCPTPGGVKVSCDYLLYIPTFSGYDVLIDEEGSGTPSWGGPHDMWKAIQDGSRTIVHPTEPFAPAPSPTPEPIPSVDLTPVLNDLQIILAQIAQGRANEKAEHDAMLAELQAFRAAVKQEYEGTWKKVSTYVPAVIGGLLALLGR